MADVTCILLNWRRPENIPHIVKALRSQTEPPDLLLVNNAGFLTFGVKKTVHIPWNAGPWIRIPFSAHAETEYVMWMDDDLVPTHPAFVASLRKATDLRRDCICGTHGKRLAPAPSYYSKAPDADGWVHIVKGRCLMFRRNVLERVTLSNAIRPWKHTHEDIYLSLEVARGRQHNWVEPNLRNYLEELPAPYAESDKPGHYTERDEAVAWHLARIAVDDVLARAETIPHLCTREEMRFLHECAMLAPEGSEFVECGCYQGSSAVVLADAAYHRGARLTLIDRFSYSTQEYGVNSPELVRGNLERANVPHVPRIVAGSSIDVPDDLKAVGFLHIDTDHRAEWLNKELDVWLPKMAPGAVLAFHDYCENSPEMIPAIDERIGADPQWQRIGLERWMIAFQRINADG